MGPKYVAAALQEGRTTFPHRTPCLGSSRRGTINPQRVLYDAPVRPPPKTHRPAEIARLVVGTRHLCYAEGRWRRCIAAYSGPTVYGLGVDSGDRTCFPARHAAPAHPQARGV